MTPRTVVLGPSFWTRPPRRPWGRPRPLRSWAAVATQKGAALKEAGASLLV